MTRWMRVFLCLGSVAACGGGGGGTPVTFQGTIQSLGESGLSWDGLQLALVCQESLQEGQQYVYHANQEYRVQAITGDHSFSFDLPGDIEDAWVGSYPFEGSSCHFSPVIYNDADSDNTLDCDLEVFLDCDDPVALLGENSEALSLIYVRDPDRVMGAPPDIQGWLKVVGVSDYDQNFDRDHLLEVGP